MNITLFIIILAFAGSMHLNFTAAQNNRILKVGDEAPVFTARDDNNQIWDLSNYLGKKNIVIFFYPAAMTGGCTSQACAYRDNFQDLHQENAIVVGISGDEAENLALFKKAHNLNFPLLADPSGEVAMKFGVPTSAGGSINREIEGLAYTLNRGVTAKRWTFIINQEGKIAYINQEVNAGNDSRDVINVLKSRKPLSLVQE